MKTIHKYVRDAHGMICYPAGGEMRHIDWQGRHHLASGVLTFWIEVDPQHAPRNRRIHTVGTGQPVPTDTVYIGTVMDGPYVWHLYW